MEHKLQIHEFFVEGGDSLRSHVLLHITEPSTPEEREKGYFFAVCELNGASKEQIIRLQEIIDQIENDYYLAEDELGKSAFEIVLEKVNHSGFSLTEEDVEMHCLAGVIRQPEIIFSYYGTPTLNLFYKTKDGLFKVMELVNREGNEEKNESQLFSQVIQGKVSPNDFLFVGTPHITETFDADRLSKLLTSRPPRLSAEHLQKVLTEIKNGNSFGGLIINYVPTIEGGQVPVAKKSPAAKGSGAKSLNHLFRTEKDTSQTLSSSLLPRLNERLKNVWHKTNDEEETGGEMIEERLQPDSTPPAEIQSNHRRALPTAVRHGGVSENRTAPDWTRYFTYAWQGIKILGKILLWIVMIIWTILLTLGHLLVNLFYLATNLKGRRRAVVENFKQQSSHYARMIQDLPLVTKILLALAIIAVLIFSGNIIYSERKSANETAAALFNENITLISNKTDSAESALIYNDQTGALKELQGAKEIFATLPCDNQKNSAICNELAAKLENLSLKLRRLVVANTETIYDWSAQSATRLEQVVKIGSKIIGFNSSTPKLYVFDELTKKGEVLSTPAGAGFTLSAVPKENDYALFVYNNKELFRYSPENNSVEKITVNSSETTPEIGGLVVYNRRLYLIDKASGMITKHDSIKGGFGKGTNWLVTPATNFDQAIDLTVDGDVFVLEKNGEIQKFTKGQKQNFVIQGLEPTLEAPQKIWSYNDLDYLYVLEPSEKRVVMLEKDGRVKQQLTSKDFTYPNGLVVIEENKTLYTLDNNRLMKLTWK